MALNSYRLTFTINGHRTEEIVRASSKSEAREIIKNRYRGEKISFISTGHEYM